jgi:RNA polymerase sigma-70 factor, ECF subfamily
VLVDEHVFEHGVRYIHSAINQSKLPANRPNSRLHRHPAGSHLPTAAGVDVVQVKLGRRRERPQLIESAQRIHTLRHTQDDHLSIEPLQHPDSHHSESGSHSRINAPLLRGNCQDLSADNRGPIAIGLNDGSIASNEIPHSEPPDVPKHPQVRPGIFRYGRRQRNLGQRGKAHVGHSDLRLGRRDQYHRENECQLSHGCKCIGARPDREETCITVRITGISRMPAVNDDLGEQIVQLLPRLRRFARSLINNVQDADDLVQLAIERALSRSEQLRPGARLSSWMFGILRNAWIDESRSKGRRSRMFVPEELGENIADPTASGQADALSVQDAMARLPIEQREVIGLVLVEGLSYKEAAEIVGVPVGTITSRLARGRDSLQSMLGALA